MQQSSTITDQRVAVIFGGESVEHEVSVITAHQVMAALGATRHEVVPVYITKSGRWYTGAVLSSLESFTDLDRLIRTADPVHLNIDPNDPGLVVAPGGGRGAWWGRGRRQGATIPIDVAMPVTHGGGGEDGALQGLLEMAGLPYAGSGVAASAISMDKSLAKIVMRSAGLPVLPDLVIDRSRLRAGGDAVLSEVEDRFPYPVFVKPVSLGSSIAAGQASERGELADRMETAAAYDRRVMIEPAQVGLIEVNCSVLGSESRARPSVCEQPVSEGMLTYHDKYAAGGKGKGMEGSRRIVPAPIGDELTGAVTEAAVCAFRAVGAAGVARVDFFVDQASGAFFVNEVNTIPGSLAFYLWEPAGVTFPMLLEEVIGLARDRHRDRAASTRSIPSWLLSGRLAAGAKVGRAAAS